MTKRQLKQILTTIEECVKAARTLAQEKSEEGDTRSFDYLRGKAAGAEECKRLLQTVSDLVAK